MSSSRTAHAHAIRFYVAVALGVLALSVGVVLKGRARELAHGGRVQTTPSDPEAIVNWCADGLEPIVGGGCFAAATPSSKPPALLIYLHGRYAEESEAEEMTRQTRVARLGTARGYAVLTFRGMQGQCTDPRLAAWWCWPSNERNATDGPAFVARWSSAIAEAERRAKSKRRVLIGFSNGGYFASLLASRGLLPLDAVAVAHAGPVAPMTPSGSKPPLLLVDADDDPSSSEILHLDADLKRESWPHEMVIREGGHALPDWDVEMALTFFDRVRVETLPLSPPLSPLRPPHPHDAAPPEDPELVGNAYASANANAGVNADADAGANANANANAGPDAAGEGTGIVPADTPASPDPVLDPTP